MHCHRLGPARFAALAALIAAGGCSDGEPASTPGASTCSDASCAGSSAGQGGGGAAAAGSGGGSRAGQGGASGSRAGAGASAGGRAGDPANGAGGGAADGGAAAGAAAGGGAGASGAGGTGAGAGGAGGTGAGSDAGGGGSAAPSGDCVACESYAAPAELARVQVRELDAISGAAAGRKNPQLVYAHNDRNRPVVYALDVQGALRARLALDAPATDIEDIAVGPCDGETCIFLADIGDNAAQRAEYAVLRFVEPELLDASGAMLTPSFERLRFTYEDGSHNAEGFMVDPGSGKLYVVTKVADGQPSRVYRIEEPASGGAVRRAVKVADLSVPKASDMAVSAAAAQPCGRGFVLRTYNTMYEFRIAAGAAFESAFSVAPVALNAPSEAQSEAIDYVPDGRGILSSGEGAAAPIYVTRCQP